MSSSPSATKTAGLSGRVVFGIVTKVLPFGAFLSLPDMVENGYLSINQVSDKRIDPPLTNTLSEGDRVEVLVKWFDDIHKTWETSHKAVVQRQRLQSAGLTIPGTRIRAKVLHAGEHGAIVDVEGVRARISGGSDAWNAYNVLYEAGCLTSEVSLEVVMEGWEPAQPRPKLRLHLGEPLQVSRGTTCNGQVIFVRKNVVVKAHNMHDDLYVRLVGGEIAWINLKDVMAADKTFPLGTAVPLVVGKYSPSLGMFEATIDWDSTKSPTPQQPEAGTVIDAKVTAVRTFGAICLIADRVKGLLHHSAIIEEKSGDTRRHLRPGDMVRVIVDHPTERGTVLRFVQLLDRILEPEYTEDADLIDLRVSRRTGGPSGFGRDQNFRWNVLDAFDHTCCICGERHVFGQASAMEAAHIIPRARRGADTARNSLCLCSLHHWALDKGFLTIDEHLRVVVARQIIDLGQAGFPLSRYHGNKIHVRDETMISTNALQWHRENVFLDEPN